MSKDTKRFFDSTVNSVRVGNWTNSFFRSCSVNPNEIFIKPSERLTLGQFLPMASGTMSLIAGAAENVNEINETFLIADLTALLNKICIHMEGKFEVRRMPSDYYQIVYKPDLVLESCDVFAEGFRVKYPTPLMRALADLQDAGLIRWNVEGGTFEILYITPYEPAQRV